ncbi:MAG TPA: hypothetical protein PKK33_09120, partial [Candidatus Cloacimonadota bacterium]|nr:hypothetical protein [Candidatus Cloacimonadota bacterium]
KDAIYIALNNEPIAIDLHIPMMYKVKHLVDLVGEMSYVTEKNVLNIELAPFQGMILIPG